MKIISYQAIFLDAESVEKLLELQSEKLPKNPKDMHCTFKFNPTNKEIKDFARTLLGRKVILKVIGYASNGKNSGFEVALEPEQQEVYTNSHIVYEKDIPKVEKTIPHITVSMSEDAKAVDTGFLKFKPLKETFKISGRGGFFVVDRFEKTSNVIYAECCLEKTLDQTENTIEK